MEPSGVLGLKSRDPEESKQSGFSEVLQDISETSVSTGEVEIGSENGAAYSRLIALHHMRSYHN